MASKAFYLLHFLSPPPSMLGLISAFGLGGIGKSTEKSLFIGAKGVMLLGLSDGIFDEQREDYPQPPGEMVHHNLKTLKITGCKGCGEALRRMKFLLQSVVALNKFMVDISKDVKPWTVEDIQAISQAP
ncbi:uncharacterized protein A4U43_C03F11550 [Asparagus officinalis]|uniref:Uncharacterized protein n=1 Tax=Asparagus officinalis TaxID=4686 RepID=A0A5P1F973_ASPOF|nr:uncharacterized protein A4U43_C03F11550 [Asparagus officinalis]